MPTQPVITITGQDTVAPIGTKETIQGVTATGTTVTLGTAIIQPNHLFGFTLTGQSYPSFLISDTGSGATAGAGAGAGKVISVFVPANGTATATDPVSLGTLTATEATSTVKTNNGNVGGNGNGNGHPA